MRRYMERVAVAIGTAEVFGAIALIVATFTIPAFVDMSLAWRILAVFMSAEGSNRLRGQL
jgi:hypothetical protein